MSYLSWLWEMFSYISLLEMKGKHRVIEDNNETEKILESLTA